jgi:hypothetical protein
MPVIIDELIGTVEPPAPRDTPRADPPAEPRGFSDPERLAHELRRLEQRQARLRAD